MNARPHPYQRLGEVIVMALARRKRVGQPDVTVPDLARMLGRSESSVLYAMNKLVMTHRVAKGHDKDRVVYHLED